MNMFLNFTRAGVALAIIVGLAACGGGKSDEEVRQATTDQKVMLDLQDRVSKAEAKVAAIELAKAKQERQATADARVSELARTTVRTSQLTDKSGCTIIPAILVADPAASEFGQRMTERYPFACRQQVADYRAERRHVAATERAKGVQLAKAKDAKLAQAKKPAQAKSATGKTSVKPVAETRR